MRNELPVRTSGSVVFSLFVARFFILRVYAEPCHSVSVARVRTEEL